MSVTPPDQKIWWNEPIHRLELGWIVIAFLWGLFMFFFMIAWHFIGEQNLSTETYRVQPSAFEAKVESFAEQYQVGEESGVPVVRPPAGEDVFMLARLWEWWPVLELKKGQSYRIHLSSLDWQHGFSLQPVNINAQILPGYEMVLTVTPDTPVDQTIICNEYCGLGHHNMVGKIYVTEGGQ